MNVDMNVDPLSKKMKTIEMVDADETAEIKDPRANRLLMAISDKGRAEVQKEVENHNKTNEMIIRVLATIRSLDANTPILHSLNPEIRDANFYGIGIQNTIKILKFVQAIEGQRPGGSQQVAKDFLNPADGEGSMDSEKLLIGLVDFCDNSLT
ncbi:MAG: hypothetical protein S4CHLAM123_03690 [Chlamydiales bacterium]|nr:hypothetical protein [Chlamydiales bacterium]